MRLLQPLTAKPVLYVANVSEGDVLEPPADLPAAIAVSARLESELAELDDEEAVAMRAELGAPESGLQRVIRAAFELLGRRPPARAAPPSRDAGRGRTW